MTEQNSDQAAAEGTSKPRLLMLTHRLPYPPDRGDRIRSFNLIKQLAQDFDLAVASTSEEPIWLQHHQLLSAMCSRVALYPITRGSIRFRGGMGMLRGRAVTPSCFFRQGLCDQLFRWQEEAPFDAILTFCTGMIEYVRRLRRHTPKPFTGRHVLDLVDVDSAKWESYADSSWFPKSLVYRMEAHRLRSIEKGNYEPFDALTVVSKAEAQAYRNTVSTDQPVHAVGNGVDLTYFHPLPEAETPTLCFVGVLNYRPNSEGIIWFVQNVMTELHRQRPDVKLLIVGRHPTPKIEELSRFPGVEIVGSVPDVRAYIRESQIMIAPLLLARGVQNKVLEAMACARVALCSPAAAEGIDAEAGRDFLVAEGPESWVSQILELFEQPERCRAIAQAARTCVETRYSWEARLKPMKSLLTGQPLPPQSSEEIAAA